MPALEWFDLAWIALVVLGLAGYIAAIGKGLLSPQAIADGIKQKSNRSRQTPQSPQRKGFFTVLVLDLEGDPERRQKHYVIHALRRRGVRYRLAEQLLPAPPPAMDSVAALQQQINSGQRLLKKTNADLLVFGEVVKADKGLRLRFIGREGQHDFSQPGSTIKGLSLTDDFHKTFEQWLEAVILAIVPADDQHNKLLLESLRASEQRLADLLQRDNPPEVGRLPAGMLWTLAGLRVRIGELGGDNAMLGKAIADYRRILAGMERATAPLDWAWTQNNLGLALFRLGERKGGTERLEVAVAAFEAALTVFEAANAEHHIGETQGNLERALTLLAQRRE